MSDEDIMTKPTIETVLERINALAQSLQDFRNVVEERLERIETRLDRVQSMALDVRADMRELRMQLKERVPEIK